MICANCTLFHPSYTPTCQGCGRPLHGALQRTGSRMLDRGPLAIGVISGTGLLGCLTLTLIQPTLTALALDIGSYFGIVSIANIWLSVYRDGDNELLRGMRGLGYSLALMVSLIGELARLQQVSTIPLPIVGSIPTPSALTTELLAAVLIIFDPLVLRPLLRWVAEGVQYAEPAYATAEE